MGFGDLAVFLQRQPWRPKRVRRGRSSTKRASDNGSSCSGVDVILASTAARSSETVSVSSGGHPANPRGPGDRRRCRRRSTCAACRATRSANEDHAPREGSKKRRRSNSASRMSCSTSSRSASPRSHGPRDLACVIRRRRHHDPKHLRIERAVFLVDDDDGRLGHGSSLDFACCDEQTKPSRSRARPRSTQVRKRQWWRESRWLAWAARLEVAVERDGEFEIALHVRRQPLRLDEGLVGGLQPEPFASRNDQRVLGRELEPALDPRPVGLRDADRGRRDLSRRDPLSHVPP